MSTVSAGKQGDSTNIDRIDSCSGACTTSDSMSTLNGGSTALLDSGWTGFCGVATVEEDWYIPHSADEMDFDIDYNADYWAGSVEIRINDGGSSSTVFRDNPPGSKSYSRTKTVDMSSYGGQNVDVEYRMIDTSSDWCDMGDHGHRFTVSSSLTTSNSAPDTPTSVDPHWTGISTTPYINAYYDDPDGDYGSLEFYTSGGNYIGSCSTSSNSHCSVHYNGATSTCNWYSFKVRADDGNAQSGFSNTKSFKTGGCNDNPDNPQSLRPSSSDVPLGTDLEAYYSDPNGDSGTLYFQTSSGSSIGSCSASTNSRCSVDWSNVDSYGQDYSFQVYAEDNHGADSGTVSQSFTTNSKPEVSDLRPSGSEVVNPPTLRADVSDPDGDALTVRFYVDGEMKATDIVSGSGTASYIATGVGVGSQHSFSVEVSDGDAVTSSGSQQFTTNYRPDVQDIDIGSKDRGHSLEVSSTVTDQDGGDQIDNCEIRAEGGGDTETYTVNAQDTGSQNQAECVLDEVNFKDGSWSHLQELDFELEVTDDMGLSSSASDQARFPNHEPEIKSLEASKYINREAFKIESLIRPRDVGSDELRDCSIVVEDEDNSYSTGKMDVVNSSYVRCLAEDVGRSKFPGLNLDEEIQIALRATDVHGESSNQSIFYNRPTGIDFDYSSVVVPRVGVAFLTYQAGNRGNTGAEFETKLRNVNASFTSTGDKSKKAFLSGGESKDYSIQISPDPEFSGTKDLYIVTENLETGITTNSSIEVRVRETSNNVVSERQVPGTGSIQIIVLVLVASIVFYRRNYDILN